MRRFFRDLTEPILGRLRPKRIIEIGAAEGGHSELLAGWCDANGAEVDIIDTAPRFDVSKFLARYPQVARVHVAPSLSVLPCLSPADVILVDGDHNWFTVYNELKTVYRPGWRPLCLLHDITWPYGRRDLYYDPAMVPDEYRKEWRRGPVDPDVSGIASTGLNSVLCHAVQEGGPNNGVLTAIEDFLRERTEQFRVVTLPILFGLAIIAPNELLDDRPNVRDFLDTLEIPEHLRNLLQIEEKERIAGIAAGQRLAPLGRTPGRPWAPSWRGRSFSPSLPSEILDGIQLGTLNSVYRNHKIYKSPFDLALYLRLIGNLNPRTIIEIGSGDGGSALWFADMMAAVTGAGNVFSFDCRPCESFPKDDRIHFVQAEAPGALLAEVLNGEPHPWLVIEDSSHTLEVSLGVLRFFDPLLVAGDYIVVEDGVLRGLSSEKYLQYEDGPARAIRAFLAENEDRYVIDAELCDFYGYNVTWNPNGWLRKV